MMEPAAFVCSSIQINGNFGLTSVANALTMSVSEYLLSE